MRSFYKCRVQFLLLAMLLMWPVLALADAITQGVAPISSPSFLSTIVSVLPLLLGMAGPYVTHILQGYTQKIPAAWQPVISAVSGILIAVLTGSATGSTISPDVLALVGGISGGAGHGLLQSTPIAHPTAGPTSAGGPVPPASA